MRGLSGAAGVLAMIVAFGLAAPGPTVAGITALQVSSAGMPRSVHGSDGREHIDYDLVVTNAFTADATLTSLVVRGGGKKLLKLSGADLAAATRALTSQEPTTSVPRSSAVVIYVDVVLPRSAGRTVPKVLNHRISYALPPDAPVHQIIGSTAIDRPSLRVARHPIEIAPPLRGDGWLNANGCCDPTLPHRNTVVTANGSYVEPETFAIDYIKLENGSFHSGDGTANSDWYAYGAPIHSVSGGKVIWVQNELPDVPPFITLDENLSVTRPVQFAGNGVTVKIRPGVFVHYFHMQPGSVRVKVGQRVRTGQKLGLLGNSGNTDGPHLHFGLSDGPSTLTSDSLPFEFDRFQFEGMATPGANRNELTITGKPRTMRRSHPLLQSVTAYGGGG